MEERLARRKAQVEMHSIKKEQQMKEIEYRHDAHDKTLTALVQEGKLMDRQREEILEKYQDDLQRIQMQHNERKLYLQIKTGCIMISFLIFFHVYLLDLTGVSNGECL